MEFNLENNVVLLKTNRVCLYDADFIKYIITSRKAKAINNGQSTTIEELCEEWYDINIRNKIADYVIFCFSGKSVNTFRSYCAVSKEYKGNRKATDEHYPEEFEDQYKVVLWFQSKTMTLLFNDLEADDLVSALQDDKNTYIVSNDKDIAQVPGWHYSFSTNTIYEIPIEQAVYNLAYQLIKGDTTDNIPGIKGFGDVKVKKYLEQFSTRPKRLLDGVIYLYQLEFGQIKGIDAFVESWNLIKLRLDRGEYFKSKYIKMFDLKEYLINRIKTDVK
jgi:5'-3' exonuclease